MTMRGWRAGTWLASAVVVVAVGGALVRMPQARAQSAAMAQSAHSDSGVSMQTPPVVQPQDVPRLPAKGGGAANMPGAKRGRRAKMAGHIMTVLTLVGAAGAVYAYREIRGLRDAHARLQDTIAGQARQLAEIRAMLERTPRG